MRKKRPDAGQWIERRIGFWRSVEPRIEQRPAGKPRGKFSRRIFSARPVQAQGIHLNLPINDEELQDIIEYGPPSHEQIFEYNKLMSEFHQKLGIEFKPYGKKETANHSSDSIQFSIDMLDEVICGIESWDDEVDCQFVQGEDCYDLSRTPTQEEWLEIRRALAKLVMKEEHIGDDQVIRRILKKCCPGMKIKKEKY